MKLEDRFSEIEITVIGCVQRGNPCIISQGLTETVIEQCVEISNTETIGFAQFLKEQCTPLSGDRWDFNTNHYTITELLKFYQDGKTQG